MMKALFWFWRRIQGLYQPAEQIMQIMQDMSIEIYSDGMQPKWRLQHIL